jgi:MtaA/CmuA family methyltransferase
VNARQRFQHALRLEPVDRPPVAAVATGITVQMMERRGIFWPQAHHDADLLAGLAESIYMYTGVECIKLPFCMSIEVEAFGTPIDFRTIDTLPTESAHIYQQPSDLRIPADFFDRGRVPVVLQAIAALRKKYADEAPLVSSIVGPFTLANKLFGFDNFLVWTISNPEYVHAVMEALTPLAIRYANAQVEAGADAITLGEASCSGSLISPATYRDFIAPYHSQMAAGISAPTILHICGKSTRHLPYIAETGVTAYNFDEGVDLSAACQHLKGKVAITGSVPTLSHLLNGTPESVYQSAWECLEAGVDMLTPGCAMAPHTPLENIEAMCQAARDWGQRRPAQEALS